MKMAKKNVIITRHAETNESRLKTIRMPEESISDLINLNGRLQAEKLGNFLNLNYKIDQIHTSTAMRSVETAKIIQKYTKSEVSTSQELEEIRIADMSGMLQEERRQVWNTTLDKWKQDICFKNLGGESLQDVGIRLEKCLLKILSSPKKETVLVVAHQGVIAFGLAYMFNAVENWREFQLVNCGITIIDN